MDGGAIAGMAGGLATVLTVVGGGLAYWFKYRQDQQRSALRSSFVIIDRLEKQVDAGQRSASTIYHQYLEARVKLAEAYGACERAVDSAKRMASQVKHLGGEPEEVPDMLPKWEPPAPPQEPGFLVRTNRQNADFGRAIVRDVRDEAMGHKVHRPDDRGEGRESSDPETYFGEAGEGSRS